jgi:hypothetical protein
MAISIKFNKKNIGLGSYFTEKEAHEAYLDFFKRTWINK